MSTNYSLEKRGDHICGRFSSMASPCELLIESADMALAESVTSSVCHEASRIEQKYSRYLSNNLMNQINQADGLPVKIDEETFRLLTFANSCFELSEGMFDITSGVLRQAWKFDGSDKIPTRSEVEVLLPKIGWENVVFNQTQIALPKGFELDFGGIGKEYAVDASANICNALAPELSILINFGGDIQVTRPRLQQAFWQVGIEHPGQTDNTNAIVKIAKGGLATSGDARRFLFKEGKRYSHILNPKTGYPIAHAPRSVTVAADHCIQSGLLATLALLQGEDAETFLKEQGVTYWCFW